MYRPRHSSCMQVPRSLLAAPAHGQGRLDRNVDRVRPGPLTTLSGAPPRPVLFLGPCPTILRAPQAPAFSLAPACHPPTLPPPPPRPLPSWPRVRPGGPPSNASQNTRKKKMASAASPTASGPTQPRRSASLTALQGAQADESATERVRTSLPSLPFPSFQQWVRFRTGNTVRYNSKRRNWRRTKLGL